MPKELTNTSKTTNEEKHSASGAPLTDPRRSGRRKRARTLRLAGLSSLMGLLALASLPAQAALITINETLDISGYNNHHILGKPIMPRTVASGDQVNVTVNFLPGQALRIGKSSDYAESVRSMLLPDAHSQTTIENVLLTFFGFSETGGASSTLALASENTGILGPSFFNFLSAGQSIQFTGFNVTYDVTYLETDPNVYSNMWFSAGSSDLAVVSVPVPEPGVLSLLALGLAGLAVAQRRKPGPRRKAFPA